MDWMDKWGSGRVLLGVFGFEPVEGCRSGVKNGCKVVDWVVGSCLDL